MNVFVLCNNPIFAARYHNNKHVVKIILESRELLELAHHETAYNGNRFRGNYNNPIAKWARQRLSNYLWLANYSLALCHEYTFRYGKIHKCEQRIRWLRKNVPTHLSPGNRTPFAIVVPDDVNTGNAVESYRLYYIKYKQHIAQWKHREVPYWYRLE